MQAGELHLANGGCGGRQAAQETVTANRAHLWSGVGAVYKHAHAFVRLHAHPLRTAYRTLPCRDLSIKKRDTVMPRASLFRHVIRRVMAACCAVSA